MKMQQSNNETSIPDASENAKSRERGYRGWDKLLIVLATLLLVSLGAASLYGFRYSNVDTSVAIGEITIKKNDETLINMNVDKEMKAQVSYHQKEMAGTLVLDGAEKDTILFQLKGLTYKDGSDSSNTVFFIRMPRSGVKGDLSGAWITYFSEPSAQENYSEWAIVYEDGTVDYGLKNNMNAITAQRFKLVEQSEKDWTWQKKESVLQLKN